MIRQWHSLLPRRLFTAPGDPIILPFVVRFNFDTTLCVPLIYTSVDLPRATIEAIPGPPIAISGCHIWAPILQGRAGRGVHSLAQSAPGLELGSAATLVINDLSQMERYAHNDFVTSGSRWRFYAGAPLVSPQGTVVGLITLWNGEPRPEPGLSAEQVTLLQDFAATITKYLDTYTTRDQYQRGEQFTRGLLSFAQRR
ncbi:sensor histidine kinase response regulator (hsp90-like protein) [Paraphaeosphaeria sporulosa]